MRHARRLFFPAVLFAAACTAAEGTFKHDLYFSLKLGGQGQVMGSRPPAKSGLYRSNDRKNFEHVGPHHVWMYALAADPHQPRRLFVAAMDGILRTPDLGRNWRIMTSWDMTEPHAVAVDPNSRDHVYIGLPDGIAVSHDAGQTWVRRHEGIRRAYTQTITVDRTKAGRVLAGTEKGIYLSEDGAERWRLVQSTAQTTYDLRQSPHAPAIFFAVTSSDGAWWSDDRGEHWRRIPGVPTEHTLHNCDFDRNDPRRLAVCGWGAGVLVSEDGGKTWTDRTAGLPRREIWRVAIDPDIPGRVYASPYLEPVYVSDDFGRTWKQLGFEAAIALDIVFVPRK
jgi:photosystem II stability/assembly factor-like uncharacterized protein